MNDYILNNIGDQKVALFIPSRRKDKQLLNPSLIQEQLSAAQAIFQLEFGGTAPEGQPRIGTWRHDDGSVTIEQIRVVEATTSYEKLQDGKLRKRIEQLAANVCKEMDQDCVFVSWGSESFLIEEKTPLRDVPVIRYADLQSNTQEKMVHLCWMGINDLSRILQILSLDGWRAPSNPLGIKETGVIAEHPKGHRIKRALSEHDTSHKWTKGILSEGDILFSPAENGVTIRFYSAGKLYGPKTLHFSQTGANAKTHSILRCILLEDCEELIHLLSQKDISSNFFKGYRTLLYDLEGYLKSTGFFKGKEFNQAQLLLGRLMFIKFIERRGWLSGDQHFIRHTYKGHKNIYKDKLLPLFFKILNNNDRDTRPPELPFLNGGLFHPRENENKIDIPDDFFERVFSLFEQYQFTIEEGSESDDSIKVNPSMFGRVLESLTDPEQLKKTGIHYTPKPIAHALAFEAIVSRLSTLIGLPKDSVQEFCNGGITALSPEQADTILSILPNLRIVDPAVGSGALLLSCLEVMMAIAEYCYERQDMVLKKGKHKWGQLCRQFVCNCLFGVDITEEAVEVAKLRLWLAVAVGDVEPSPLPNLEFNIRMADSLLDENQTIPKSNPVQLKLGFDESERLSNNYFKAIKEYQQAGVANPLDQHLIIKDVEECQRALLAWMRTQDHGNDKPKKKRSKNSDHLTTIPFSWRLHFGSVFYAKQGFDIVIANPPYVRVQNIEKPILLRYKNRWSVLKDRSADLFYAFIELALDLAAPDGEIAFVIPNFSRSASGAALRELLSEKSDIRMWVDFGDTWVFPTAKNYVALLFACKRNRRGKSFPCSCAHDKRWEEQPSTQWIHMGDPNNLIDVSYGSKPWLTVPRDQAEHILKMKDYPSVLGDLVDISVGIQTSADVFYLFEEWSSTKEDGVVEVFSRGIKRSVKIEKDFLRICIKGARQKSKVGKDILLLWPYDPKAELFPSTLIENKFPKAWKYLKNIEKKLRDRGNGECDDENWYRFSRDQGFKLGNVPKVIVPAILKGGAAFFDELGEFAFTASGEGGGGAYALTPKGDNPVPLWSLSEYLRSEEVWSYIKAMGFPKNGGWRGVDRSILMKLPVPKLI